MSDYITAFKKKIDERGRGVRDVKLIKNNHFNLNNTLIKMHTFICN